MEAALLALRVCGVQDRTVHVRDEREHRFDSLALAAAYLSTFPKPSVVVSGSENSVEVRRPSLSEASAHEASLESLFSEAGVMGAVDREPGRLAVTVTIPGGDHETSLEALRLLCRDYVQDQSFSIALLGGSTPPLRVAVGRPSRVASPSSRLDGGSEDA